ncbi:metallophosphoesterase family protein [Paenibacillus hamazuiensis]|uniref:metallophosphoesterase family protein n=1 Tax=Paenibacillus hamazuiensis TaxID=2936508 RepID=UPI00200F60B4|nr:metallophosphoesterase [Paenibacillus hamazuiensis]
MSRRAFVRLLMMLLGAVAAGLSGCMKLFTKEEEAALPVTQKPEEPQPPKAEEKPPAQPGAGAEPLASFFIFSDLHVSNADPNTIKNLRKALEDVKQAELKMDALVISGDITEYGTENDYKEYRNVMKDFKLPPVYANMGNHDYYHVWIDKNGAFSTETFPNGRTDAQARERFMKEFGIGKPYSEAKVGGYQVIMMSQECYQQEKKEVGEGAWYSDEQLEWLKATLEKNKDGKPIFVMIHQPLPPAGQDGGTHRLIPAKKFREILKPYPNVFVFCGHGHQDFLNGASHYEKESFHYFINSSVGRVYNRNYQKNDPAKSQALYVQVYGDKVVLRGREFSTKSWLKEADWTIPLQKV